MPPEPAPRPLAQRLLWFAGLGIAGVAGVSLLSLALHLWIAPK